MNDERDHDAADRWRDEAARRDVAFDNRIAQVLAARADVLVIDDRPFRAEASERPADREAVGAVGLVDDSVVALDLERLGAGGAAGGFGSVRMPIGRRSTRRARAAVWVAGIAAGVVLVVALAAVNGNRSPSVTTYTGGGGLLDSQPTYVPSWVPEGLQLQDLTVQPPREQDPVRAHLQLLESDADDAAVLVYLEVDRPYFVPLGTELAAHGTTVAVRPSVETIGSVPFTELRWSEGDADISATTRDLSEADAAVLLDSLDWADPADPLAGFAAPDGWTNRSDPTLGSGSGAVTSLVYADPADPGRPALTVHSIAPGSVAPGYLLTSMVGHVGDGGVAVATQDPGRAGTSPLTYAMWPDGRRVTVSGDDGLDDATAERIALGVRPSSGEEIAAMGAELTERLGEGDVLAVGDLPAGRVELIGSPDPTAVCLTVDGTRACRASRSGVPMMEVPVITGSAAVGPTWFLFGASREGIQITDDETTDAMFPVFEDGEPLDPTMPMKISAPVVNDGEWYLSVLAVRPDAVQAFVTGDGSTTTRGRTLI